MNVKYVLMDFLNRIPGWRFFVEVVQFAEDSIRVFRQRLPSIDLESKIRNRVRDDVVEFLYGDRRIRFYVPYAGSDLIQSFIVDKARFWEQDLLEHTRRYVSRGAVVADCGANIGNHAVYWANVCGAGKVFAFEPQKIIGNILLKNIEENQLSGRVEVINKALGDRCGTMSVSHESSGNNMAVEFQYDDAGCVPVVTLDSLEFSRLDFVKIDVEGGQLDVLRGAQKTLSKLSPTIWIEMHNVASSPGFNREREYVLPRRLLSDMGYRLLERISPVDYLYVCK